MYLYISSQAESGLRIDNSVKSKHWKLYLPQDGVQTYTKNTHCFVCPNKKGVYYAISWYFNVDSISDSNIFPVLFLLPIKIKGESKREKVAILGSSQKAVNLLDDLCHCFPSTVKKSLRYIESDDSEGEIESETASAAEANTANDYMKLSEDCNILPTVFLSHAELSLAYPGVQDTVQMEEEEDTVFITLLVSNMKQLNQRCTRYPITTNLGILFSLNEQQQQEIHIPTSIAPSNVLKEFIWDHHIFSVGAKRESSDQGAGKNCSETLDDMRRRHASGSFCSIVEPTMTLEEVKTRHKDVFPIDIEWRGCQLRKRRIVGRRQNSNINLLW